MDWIRRNPKAAVALSGLVVLCAVILVWGMTSGSNSPSDEEPFLAGPSLSTPSPTSSPSSSLTVLPSPTTKSTKLGEVLNGFPTTGMGPIPPGMLGSGGDYGLPPHRVVITARSDGPLLGVGWKIPTADGKRGGKDLTYKKTFSHSTTAYGRPDYAQLYTRVGPESSWVTCTVTVDGKVTEHQRGKGPWSAVFCQG